MILGQPLCLCESSQITTSEERTVRHFHFTAWPDHGVPQGTEFLIHFRGLVRDHIQTEGTGAPTVVHCRYRMSTCLEGNLGLYENHPWLRKKPKVN